MDYDLQGYVYFYDSSDKQCVKIESLLHDISREENNLHFYEINNNALKDKEQFSEFLAKYQVESFPTLIKITDEGTITSYDKLSEATTKEVLKELIFQ